MVQWSVAVFAKNEARSMEGCLRAIDVACSGIDSHITVVINGSEDGTVAEAVRCAESLEKPVSIFTIPFADKSNAWNQFMYRLRPSAHVYFFVDAYVSVVPRAFQLLAAALNDCTVANAASGVASSGRSAAALADTMHAEGGLHGSLHALPRSFVDRLCEERYRLPIGLYRGDGLIGSMAMHDLDPGVHPWCPRRVVVVDGATWAQRVLSPFRPSDVRRQCVRLVRQARGRLENQAVKMIIYRDGYGSLPIYADDMIAEWFGQLSLAERCRFGRMPSVWAAMMQMRKNKRPCGEDLVAQHAYGRAQNLKTSPIKSA